MMASEIVYILIGMIFGHVLTRWLKERDVTAEEYRCAECGGTLLITASPTGLKVFPCPRCYREKGDEYAILPDD